MIFQFETNVNNNWNENITNILSRGIPLDSIGISNWGLNKEDAVAAVKELTRISIPLLGGDVLRWDKGKWVHTYDNWYCNSLPGESREAFAARSKRASIQYIERYEPANKSKHIFVLVPSNET